MRKGWFAFGWPASTAMCLWAAVWARSEEVARPAGSIFAADGRIPASTEEMLPVHLRLGLLRAEWIRMHSDVSPETIAGRALQGHMSADVDESFADTYRRLEERKGLFAARPSENRFVRATDAIFRPAPIRIGTTEISFTPVTAWRKRNPLCLLNPLVFHISF